MPRTISHDGGAVRAKLDDLQPSVRDVNDATRALERVAEKFYGPNIEDDGLVCSSERRAVVDETVISSELRRLEDLEGLLQQLATDPDAVEDPRTRVHILTLETQVKRARGVALALAG